MLHQPVLPNYTIFELNIKSNGVYVDCTAGHGGHSFLISQKLIQAATLILIDQDYQSLQVAKNRLNLFKGKLILIHGNFAALKKHLTNHKITKVDGFLYDLGFSAGQIYDPNRGFSYRWNGPLDMRMNQNQILTARTIVNTFSFAELKTILKNYGEEPHAHKIAFAVCQARQIQEIKTTFELVKIIQKALPTSQQTRKFPARLTFQALRIAVNNEINVLKESLSQTINFCQSGTKIVVISYHSLEDRVVKQFFQSLDVNICKSNRQLYKPTELEIIQNPQARSAKMRVLTYV